MMSRIASLMVLLALITPLAVGTATAGPEEDAAKAYDRGNALLLESSFTEAGEAFAEAARLDPKNDVYRSEESILKRVIKLRDELNGGAAKARWERVAPGLRAYYYSKAMHAEALDLDRRHHEQVGSPTTTAMLSESLLQMDRDAEAATLLSALPEADRTDVTNLLLGIALARSGRVADAQLIAADVKLAADCVPALKVLHARLMAGIGAEDNALTLLQQAFEATPPNVLASVKENVKGQRDFSALVANAGFAKVLATESKVKQSGCSGGSSCGACPSRTKCATGDTAGEKKSCDTDAHNKTTTEKKTAADSGTR